MSDFPSGRLEDSEREGRCGERRRGGVFIGREEGGGRERESQQEAGSPVGPPSYISYKVRPLGTSVCENHLDTLLAFRQRC